MTNGMAGVPARPRLRHKVCLRFDRRTGRYLLLYPERGLELNNSAAEIARLCTGEWTIDDIARQLARTHAAVSPDEINRAVRDFLKTLADRGLLEGLR